MFRQLSYIILLSLLLPIGLLATDVKKPVSAPLNQLTPEQQRKFDYFYYEAANLKNAGKYDAAFDLFSYCLSLDTASSPVLYELAMFQLQRNRPEKAGLYRNLGMYGEASASYEELVKQYPDKTELNYYLADALTQEGEIGQAIDAYNALESTMGMNEGLSLQKFKLYQTLKQPDKAFEEIEKLADKYPMNARYRLLMGDLHLENNEADKALACYQKAHEIDPDDPRYIVSMANYYDQTGNKEAAEQEIRDALVNEKLDVETKVGILSRYIQRLQQTQQDFDKANSLFQTLLDQHPEDTELKLMYGSLLMAQTRPSSSSSS